MDLGGVLVVVLITELLEGVDEGNKRDSLWELMKEIRGSCIVHDYTCWKKVVRLSMKPSLISRYHPKKGRSRKLNGVGLN
jgi:hypothetical protein